MQRTGIYWRNIKLLSGICIQRQLYKENDKLYIRYSNKYIEVIKKPDNLDGKIDYFEKSENDIEETPTYKCRICERSDLKEDQVKLYDMYGREITLGKANRKGKDTKVFVICKNCRS